MKAQAISYLLCIPSIYEICVLWASFCFALFFLMKKLSEGRVGDVDKLYIKIGNRTSIWVSRQAAGQEAPFHIRVSEFGSLILAPDSSFLPMRSLVGSGADSSSWISTTFWGDLDCIPSLWLHPSQ